MATVDQTIPAPPSDTVPAETPPAQPDQQISDANGAASSADKEWWRRKNHGGTGA